MLQIGLHVGNVAIVVGEGRLSRWLSTADAAPCTSLPLATAAAATSTGGARVAAARDRRETCVCSRDARVCWTGRVGSRVFGPWPVTRFTPLDAWRTTESEIRP